MHRTIALSLLLLSSTTFAADHCADDPQAVLGQLRGCHDTYSAGIALELIFSPISFGRRGRENALRVIEQAHFGHGCTLRGFTGEVLKKCPKASETQVHDAIVTLDEAKVFCPVREEDRTDFGNLFKYREVRTTVVSELKRQNLCR